jgi:nickel-dependent lactate racemase
MPEFSIPYGSTALQLKLPDGITVSELQGRAMAPLPDVTAAIHKELEGPVGRLPLRQQARGKNSATIVVGDPTHYNAYEVWLPAVLGELNACGVKDNRITLYLAAGTQGALSAEQKLKLFGPEIVKRVTILDHDCEASERMEKVGRTLNGTVLNIDKRVLNADLLLLIGGVQYHYFSGYTGGPKSVMPGCAGRESILQNSKYAIDPRSGDIHPWVGPGIIVGNPVSEDMHQCCTVVKPDLCINVVLNGDRQVSNIRAGDYALVLRNCAKFLDEHCRIPTVPANIAVIGAGGAPKDATLFQAYKSLRHSVDALAPEASVIWLAKCEGGEGGHEMAVHRGWTTDDIREELKRDPAPVSFCALMMRKIAQRFDVHLVSDLPPAIGEGWRFTPHADLNSALSAVVRKKQGSQRWLVGRDLSYLLPVRPDRGTPRETRG